MSRRGDAAQDATNRRSDAEFQDTLRTMFGSTLGTPENVGNTRTLRELFAVIGRMLPEGLGDIAGSPLRGLGGNLASTGANLAQQLQGLGRSFYTPEYQQNLEGALMAQSGGQAAAAARAGQRAGGGNLGGFGGGSQAAARSAQESIAPTALGAILGSRAQTEQQRAGLQSNLAGLGAQLTMAGLQGQVGVEQNLLQSMLGLRSAQAGLSGDLAKSIFGFEGQVHAARRSATGQERSAIWSII